MVSAILLSSVPFAIPANAGMYELGLPRERQSVPDDRPKISGEIAELAKREAKGQGCCGYSGLSKAHRMGQKMKRKPKSGEPSLLNQLSKPLRDFGADFQEHGADAMRKVREDNPTKYLELATKLLPLIVALNPGVENAYSDCQNMADVGAQEHWRR
jgi:hypothetical protein